MLMPAQATAWDTAPYFWMLGIIEMIQTAENCRVRRGKYVFTHTLFCFWFPGGPWPVGAGDAAGEQREGDKTQGPPWPAGAGAAEGEGRWTIFTSHLAGARVGAQQGRLVGFAVSGHAPSPLRLGIVVRGVLQPELVVARPVLSCLVRMCVQFGWHFCWCMHALVVGLCTALAWPACLLVFAFAFACLFQQELRFGRWGQASALPLSPSSLPSLSTSSLVPSHPCFELSSSSFIVLYLSSPSVGRDSVASVCIRVGEGRMPCSTRLPLWQ